MGKKIVVQNDAVEGTDKHNVMGDATNPSPPPPSIPSTVWVADFDYVGKMTDGLSDFVHINGQAIALKTSKSSLNPGEDVAPTGKHSGAQGKTFVPPAPPPFPATQANLTITDPIGDGKPNLGAGSRFVSIGGTAILLDGDRIDTCDGLSVPGNSTVSAANQDFVSCSE
ncbi:MAG: hypothetical protein ACHWZW_20890 [Spirulina sp.]